jgi:outer membrane protein assembly factor BamC
MPWLVPQRLPALIQAALRLEESKIDYKSASQAPTLGNPPDLTQLKRDSRYQVAGFQQRTQPVPPSAGICWLVRPTIQALQAIELANARIERTGTQRYLVIQQSADFVWEPLQRISGKTMVSCSISTNPSWASWRQTGQKIALNCLKIFRKAVGKIFDSLYSTGERDRFRNACRDEQPMVWKLPSRISGMAEIYTSPPPKMPQSGHLVPRSRIGN